MNPQQWAVQEVRPNLRLIPPLAEEFTLYGVRQHNRTRPRLGA